MLEIIVMSLMIAPALFFLMMVLGAATCAICGVRDKANFPLCSGCRV